MPVEITEIKNKKEFKGDVLNRKFEIQQRNGAYSFDYAEFPTPENKKKLNTIKYYRKSSKNIKEIEQAIKDYLKERTTTVPNTALPSKITEEQFKQARIDLGKLQKKTGELTEDEKIQIKKLEDVISQYEKEHPNINTNQEESIQTEEQYSAALEKSLVFKGRNESSLTQAEKTEKAKLKKVMNAYVKKQQESIQINRKNIQTKLNALLAKKEVERNETNEKQIKAYQNLLKNINEGVNIPEGFFPKTQYDMNDGNAETVEDPKKRKLQEILNTSVPPPSRSRNQDNLIAELKDLLKAYNTTLTPDEQTLAKAKVNSMTIQQIEDTFAPLKPTTGGKRRTRKYKKSRKQRRHTRKH